LFKGNPTSRDASLMAEIMKLEAISPKQEGKSSKQGNKSSD
jgi:hypothetical protein